MSYIEKIVNIETGEEIEKAYTTAQIKEAEKFKIQAEETKALLDAKAAEKEALLVKLGLTADEAKLLLG